MTLPGNMPSTRQNYPVINSIFYLLILVVCKFEKLNKQKQISIDKQKPVIAKILNDFPLFLSVLCLLHRHNVIVPTHPPHIHHTKHTDEFPVVSVGTVQCMQAIQIVMQFSFSDNLL